MLTRRLVLRPLTAFGSPLTGDTLFGQFCWTLRYKLGEERLRELLEGYCDGRPFAVFSDAFPQGFVPLPTLPFLRTGVSESKRWVAREHLGKDLEAWRQNACTDTQAYTPVRPRMDMQPHNSINRLTGTTGKGDFAPYARSRIWHHPETKLDLYVLVDEDRLEMSKLREVLDALGEAGYGRDASAGLGKFRIEDAPEDAPARQARASESFLTLAPCAPQGLGYDAEKSYYQLKTHFGRHGDTAALSRPFKRPILLAKTGAVFSLPEERAVLFLGQGIGNISGEDPRAVHQGYAPVIPLSGLGRNV